MTTATNNAAIQCVTHHFDGPGDPSWGRPLQGVNITLSLGGSALLTKTTGIAGWTEFAGLAPGNYTLAYEAPAGTGFYKGQAATQLVDLAPGANVWPPTVGFITLAVPSVLTLPDTSFDGYGRFARDILSGIGVCSDLNFATAEQTAAALEYAHIPLLRVNGLANNGSLLPQMQAVRSAQMASGSIRPAKFYCLTMAYMNDLTPWTVQQPLIMDMLKAGVLWGLSGPNEMNNPSTGGGSRGPNDVLNKSGASSFAANMRDWATGMYAFKEANRAAFGDVFITGGSVAPITGGQAGDYPANDLTALVDYWDMHFYAPFGYQPGFPFGVNPGIGYFGVVESWAAAAYGGIRQGILSESGKSTTGAPCAAKDGVSQAKYIANQQLDFMKRNGKACFTYCLWDYDSADTSNTENCYGIFMSNKTTPKPAATIISRMQSIRALNLNANDHANVNDTATFKPGIDMKAISVQGLKCTPTSEINAPLPGVLAEYKSDGSSIVWVWNEAEIDFTSVDGNGNRLGGAEMIPAANPLTVYFPRSRQFRVHDPMASTDLTQDPWQTGEVCNVTVAGYPMAIEVAAAVGWTAAGGDPADVPARGFATFTLGQYAYGGAHNYGGTKPDDCFITITPSTESLWTCGNNVVLLVVTALGNKPTCPAATLHMGPFSPGGSRQQIDVFVCPVMNPHAAFTVSNTGSFAQMHAYEIPQFSAHGCTAYRAPMIGNYGTTGMSITAEIDAVPAGALALFVTSMALTGQQEIPTSADPTVKTLMESPIDESGLNTYNMGFSGVVTAGRAAAPAKWVFDYGINDQNQTPVTAMVWFTK